MRSENPGAVVSGALPRLESLAKAAGTHHHTERAGGRGARTLCGAALRMGAVGERERYLVRCAGGERPLKERFVSHRRRFGQGAWCPGSTNLSAQQGPYYQSASDRGGGSTHHCAGRGRTTGSGRKHSVNETAPIKSDQRSGVLVN